MLTVAAWISGILLGLATVLVIVRIMRGPSILERAIAMDVLLAIIIAALCIDMAVAGHTDHLAFVVLACVLGFIGSVTISRYVTDRRNS
ncbi:monovalent cation/H+ antiporter complex subunit F [Zhihengliuella halotolerans]|uniref:Multisubunit sodium/proton antiporter MrpF subunit n=1 Tax=Zhihengliuella halotolerans TaxID=370736 RepID=A0A4Q8AE45_9MICC|nr:monovalent cation/H+ antiporter complex subunit F [Zhihengliuella halotolerans]RZU62434.1 multisubunit sodium/proton antiporter MrpF subunit [Zhihengliuella halotolerans]